MPVGALVKTMGRVSIFTICIALLLQASPAAAVPYKSWARLTAQQQEALQPLTTQWDALPPKLQRNLLIAANQYPQLTSPRKMLFQSRLEKWARLTPEQRQRAREKFMAFKKVRPEIRKQVIEMAHEEQAGNAAASSVQASTPAPNAAASGVQPSASIL